MEHSNYYTDTSLIHLVEQKNDYTAKRTLKVSDYKIFSEKDSPFTESLTCFLKSYVPKET